MSTNSRPGPSFGQSLATMTTAQNPTIDPLPKLIAAVASEGWHDGLIELAVEAATFPVVCKKGQSAIDAYLRVTASFSASSVEGKTTKKVLMSVHEALWDCFCRVTRIAVGVSNGKVLPDGHTTPGLLEKLPVLMPDDSLQSFGLDLLRRPLFYKSLRRLLLAHASSSRRKAWRVFMPGTELLGEFNRKVENFYWDLFTGVAEAGGQIIKTFTTVSWPARRRLAYDVGLLHAAAISAVSTPLVVRKCLLKEELTLEEMKDLPDQVFRATRVVLFAASTNCKPWLKHVSAKQDTEETKDIARISNLLLDIIKPSAVDHYIKMQPFSALRDPGLNLSRLRNSTIGSPEMREELQEIADLASTDGSRALLCLPALKHINTVYSSGSDEHENTTTDEFFDFSSVTKRFKSVTDKMVDSCDACGKKGPEPENDSEGALKRCTRCKIGTYCSADCQRGAWDQHKTSCFDASSSEM